MPVELQFASRPANPYRPPPQPPSASLLTPRWNERDSVDHIAGILRRVGLINPLALAPDTRTALSRTSSASDWLAWLAAAGYPRDAAQRLSVAICALAAPLGSEPEREASEIQAAIRSCGFTQAEIASASGITTSEISNFATGKRPPTPQKQERIYTAIATLRERRMDALASRKGDT